MNFSIFCKWMNDITFYSLCIFYIFYPLYNFLYFQFIHRSNDFFNQALETLSSSFITTSFLTPQHKDSLHIYQYLNIQRFLWITHTLPVLLCTIFIFSIHPSIQWFFQSSTQNIVFFFHRNTSIPNFNKYTHAQLSTTVSY